MNGQESVVARGEEIEAGTLPWVEKQASQYIRYGEEATYDEATGEVDKQLVYAFRPGHS
jgi:hypothetical protein